MNVTLTLSTPEIAISDNAKICYGTTTSKDITDSLVNQHKHLASLRFAYATFHIDGISIACQNQFVRSSHLDFMVQSKRYVSNKKGSFDFIMPLNLSVDQRELMQSQWDSALDAYNILVASGTPKEDARAILPANTSTAMNATGNLQGWRDACKLRLSSHAQLEIRTVFIEIFKLLQEQYPQVFTDDLFIELSK